MFQGPDMTTVMAFEENSTADSVTMEENNCDDVPGVIMEKCILADSKYRIPRSCRIQARPDCSHREDLSEKALLIFARSLQIRARNC